jgi:hypothetical protein
MFREQYRPDGRVSQNKQLSKATATDLRSTLRQKHALSEVKLRHPTLPFLGILDLVQLTATGVEIVDFKTGRPSEKHGRQLLRYALLWWRTTGDAPKHVSARYLDGVESWPVTQAALIEVEADIGTKIPLWTNTIRTHPAVARPGASCHSCPVRARCALGWSVDEDAARRGDVEVVALTARGDHGFLARSRVGADVAIVYDASIARLIPKHVEGQALRILDAVWAESGSLEIKAWTEVFTVE